MEVMYKKEPSQEECGRVFAAFFPDFSKAILEAQEKLKSMHKSFEQDLCNIRELLKMREKPISKIPVKIKKRKPRKHIPELSSEENFSIPISSSANPPTIIIDTTCDFCDTISTINASVPTTSSVNPYDVFDIDFNVIIDAHGDDTSSTSTSTTFATTSANTNRDLICSEDNYLTTTILDDSSDSELYFSSVLSDPTYCKTLSDSTPVSLDSVSTLPVPMLLLVFPSVAVIHMIDSFLLDKYYTFTTILPTYINNHYIIYIWDPGK